MMEATPELSTSSPVSETPAPLYGSQTNPFANFTTTTSSATSVSPAPLSNGWAAPPSSFGTSLSNSSVDDLAKRTAPLSMSTSFAPLSQPAQPNPTQAQIVQNQQKLQLQQLTMYKNQQQQQLSHQPPTLGASAQLSQIQSQIQQQQIGQQQQQLQQFMNTVTEYLEKLSKSLSDVDQRISSLEKSTREIMVNQKTQKELVQQQLNQILQKIGDVRPQIPQAISVAPALPSHPVGLAPMNIPAGPMGIPMPAPSAPAFVQPTPFYGGVREKRDQEDADAEMARRLQAELNAESTRTSSAPARPVEPTEDCPVCNEKIPKSGLEGHVQKHFDEEPARSAAAASSAEGGLWSKLFGNKQAEEKKKQEEEAARKKKQEEEETLRKKSSQQSNNTQSSSQSQPPMQAIPYQAPYYLAPAFQPTMVYRAPGTGTGLYPGQMVFDPNQQQYTGM